jgi:hypothetical protein
LIERPGLKVFALQHEYELAAAFGVEPGGREGRVGENGVRREWHLLKLFRVPMESDISPGQRTRFHQERIGFWSSFDGSWLDTAGPVSDTQLSNQVVEKVYGRLLEVRGEPVLYSTHRYTGRNPLSG